MKRLLLFLLFCAAALAQPIPQIRTSTGAPVGACQPTWLDVDITQPNLYACGPGNVWSLVGATGVVGVASFASRTGNVVPTLNDYSFSLLSGSLADSQLPADAMRFVGSTANLIPYTTSSGFYGNSSLQRNASGAVGAQSGFFLTRVAVPFAAGSPVFDFSAGSVFSVTLTGAATATTSNATAIGTSTPLFGVEVCQDATGGRTFTWPTGFSQAFAVDPRPNVCQSQYFVWDGANARPLGPATYSAGQSTLFISGTQQAAPGTNPAAGSVFCWFDTTDQVLECKNSTGTVTKMGAGGGGGTPGTPVNSVQFNSAGSFAGDANLTWDSVNKALNLGPGNASQLAALDAALFDNLASIGIGDGSATFGSSAIYSGGGSNGALYFVTSGGTFASPTNAANGNGMGFMQGAFYNSGWKLSDLFLGFILDDISTGHGHIVTIPMQTQITEATRVGHTIQRFSAQTADMAQFLQEDGTTVLSGFTSAGDFYDNNLSVSLPVQTNGSKKLISAAINLNSSQVVNSGSAPALTSCGTSPAIAGSNLAGTVTEGTVATGCTITFAGAPLASAPHCTVVDEAGLVFSYTISSSAITVTNVGALSSTKLDYVCVL